MAHISRIDLNLFVVLEAIYSEGNITRASQKLNRKRPAHSPLFTHRRQWQQLIKATFWPRG